MTWVVFLDTGVLGFITHPKANEETTQCTTWLRELLVHGVLVCILEVCDYELRRDYLRRAKREKGAQQALEKLDALKNALNYIPIRTDMMGRAAELWATTRNNGRPTADPKELDVDVILAAQAQLTAAGNTLTIATTNVGHLSLFADARAYTDIPTA